MRVAADGRGLGGDASALAPPRWMRRHRRRATIALSRPHHTRTCVFGLTSGTESALARRMGAVSATHSTSARGRVESTTTPETCAQGRSSVTIARHTGGAGAVRLMCTGGVWKEHIVGKST